MIASENANGMTHPQPDRLIPRKFPPMAARVVEAMITHIEKGVLVVVAFLLCVDGARGGTKARFRPRLDLMGILFGGTVFFIFTKKVIYSINATTLVLSA